MILNPGELDFITEQDIKTGVRSNYYKIGIVRESDGRNSKDRMLEHQTGNPRKLCVVETLQMPAVEYIETNLHYLFARNRVMGEWMEFSPEELQIAIDKAKQLKDEMASILPDIKKAEDLGKVVSTGSKIAATDESKYWHKDILTFREVMKACDDALTKYNEYLYTAIDKGVIAPGVAKIQQRSAPRKFDEKMFATNYPDLYSQYAENKITVKQQFRITVPKDWSSDLSALGTEQVYLLAEFINLLENSDHSLETGFVLHEKHLAVLEVRQFAKWREEIADIKIRVLTGDSDGIDGVCTWKREEKMVVTLDKKAVQANHPNEYNLCVIEGKASEALIVEPKSAEALN